jgi:hypothetical protein
MAHSSIEFRAPWSKTLRASTIMSCAILSMMGVLPWLIDRSSAVTYSLSALSLLVVLATLPFRVRGYVLTDGALLVKRGGWMTQLPLAGLQSVSGDVEAMRGSVRIFGNGGLFSITGEFWNRRLGRYRALATDPSRAVILRYPRRVIVITPHDPQHFIMRARTLLNAVR